MSKISKMSIYFYDQSIKFWYNASSSRIVFCRTNINIVIEWRDV